MAESFFCSSAGKKVVPNVYNRYVTDRKDCAFDNKAHYVCKLCKEYVSRQK